MKTLERKYPYQYSSTMLRTTPYQGPLHKHVWFLCPLWLKYLCFLWYRDSHQSTKVTLNSKISTPNRENKSCSFDGKFHNTMQTSHYKETTVSCLPQLIHRSLMLLFLNLEFVVHCQGKPNGKECGSFLNVIDCNYSPSMTSMSFHIISKP